MIFIASSQNGVFERCRLSRQYSSYYLYSHLRVPNLTFCRVTQLSGTFAVYWLPREGDRRHFKRIFCIKNIYVKLKKIYICIVSEEGVT